MAQPTSLPEEPQVGAQPLQQPQPTSAIPSSPTKRLWKRLLARSSSVPPDHPTGTIDNNVDTGRLPSPEAVSTSLSAHLPLAGSPGDAEAGHGMQQSSDMAARGAPSSHDDATVVGPVSNSRRTQRDVVPNLPRTQTFARQKAELRENLLPMMPSPDERRAASVDRRLARSVSSPTSSSHTFSSPRASAPNIFRRLDTEDCAHPAFAPNTMPRSTLSASSIPLLSIPDNESKMSSADGAASYAQSYGGQGRLSLSATAHTERHDKFVGRGSLADETAQESYCAETCSLTSSQYDQKIRYELEHVWILNLSMHFRDKSRREKFFVTYRQRPDLSRRVTVSLDYRNAPEGSLELDLLSTKHQRDKNEMIYEAIRDSLGEIQFYNTVTNLKLQTTDNRLHVHVVEDVSVRMLASYKWSNDGGKCEEGEMLTHNDKFKEIIDYPTSHTVKHLTCRKIRECDVQFESHMSGFVYKVRVDDRALIKKEIPGPDSVDEFLYEVNALNFLRGSHSVIDLYGVVIGDDDRVKGLLISYAEQGALIDIIYENNHGIPWPTRMKWARQIVLGLSEIHEAGFVQGDFTLSNIVIDDSGDAKIIDINRRGCPVGWEPPEATPLINSDQRISMYIGVKSDLFQLGMVLWALATQEDNPEAHGRPLRLGSDVFVPQWYRAITGTCLAEDPRERAQARNLLSYFPDMHDEAARLGDSDCDDDWYEGPPNPVFYAYSAPSGSVDGDDPMYHKLGVESAPSTDDNSDETKNRESNKKESTAAGPRVETVTPTNGWTPVNFGHTYVDALDGVSTESYYYPTRGRSPPRSSVEGRCDSVEGASSLLRTGSLEKQGQNESQTDDPAYPSGLGILQDNTIESGRKLSVEEVRVEMHEAAGGDAAEGLADMDTGVDQAGDSATLKAGESKNPVDDAIGFNSPDTSLEANDTIDQHRWTAMQPAGVGSDGPANDDTPKTSAKEQNELSEFQPAPVKVGQDTSLLGQMKGFGVVMEETFPTYLGLNNDDGKNPSDGRHAGMDDTLNALIAA